MVPQIEDTLTTSAPSSPRSVSAEFGKDFPLSKDGKNFFELLFLPFIKKNRQVRFDDENLTTYYENEETEEYEEQEGDGTEDPRWYTKDELKQFEQDMTNAAVQKLRTNKAWGSAITRAYGMYCKVQSLSQAMTVFRTVAIPPDGNDDTNTTVGLESWVCSALIPNRRKTLQAKLLTLQKKISCPKERMVRMAKVSEEFSRVSVLMAFHVARSIVVDEKKA